MREGEGYTTDENLLASQLLAFCEGMLSRFVRSEFKYRPTDDFDARWPLIAGFSYSNADWIVAHALSRRQKHRPGKAPPGNSLTRQILPGMLAQPPDLQPYQVFLPDRQSGLSA